MAFTQTTSEIFFEAFIDAYVKDANFVQRPWIENQIETLLNDNACKFVLLTAEPGAGKTAISCALSSGHNNWLRYFIRRDSISALTPGDAQSFFFTIGHQLASRHPDIFDPGQLQIVVTQRVNTLAAGGSVTGITIEDLKVSPFYQTALRVQQEVNLLHGTLSGIEIKNMTAEPRLQTIDVLQYLSLIDPAAALSKLHPDQQIVIIIDGIDEIGERYNTQNIMDWLELGVELPPNVRFILTSRPIPRLDILRARHKDALREISIDSKSFQVTADVLTYARKIFRNDAVAKYLAKANIDELEKVLVAKSDGNFAYITAFGKSLQQAAASGNDAMAEEVLKMESLPEGLYNLYWYFLQLIKKSINALGALEVLKPVNENDQFVAPWEGVGQRLLSVLTVIQKPVTLDQLMAFSRIRTSRSEALNVFRKFAPFLDEIQAHYQLFHLSVAQWLTSEETKKTNPNDWIDSIECHHRILSYYKSGAQTWNEVDWDKVDDYGLQYTTAHIIRTETDSSDQLIALVKSNLSAAMYRRFKSNVPFMNIIDLSLKECRKKTNPGEYMYAAIFLSLSRTLLLRQGSRSTPAMLALMAKLGRIDEALAYLELMPPSEQRFVSLTAIMDYADKEALEKSVGYVLTNKLVEYALNIVENDSIFSGYAAKKSMTEAAKRLMRSDKERAFRLAKLVQESSGEDISDELYEAAALSSLQPAEIKESLDRMGERKIKACLTVISNLIANKQTGAAKDLMQEAFRLIAKEKKDKRLEYYIDILEQAIAAADEKLIKKALPKLAQLIGAEMKKEKPAYGFYYSLVRAARQTRYCNAELTGLIFDYFEQAPFDGAYNTELANAAELAADLGMGERCRKLVDKCLVYERGLGWYGPAGRIARLGVILSKVDAEAGKALIKEGEDLIKPQIGKVDSFESYKVDSAIRDLCEALASTDMNEALKWVEFIQSEYWIRGSDALSMDNRLSARCVYGLRLLDTDRARAETLLNKCIAESKPTMQFGRFDPTVITGGFFRPVSDEIVSDPIAARSRGANFIAFLTNVFNYWKSKRQWCPFKSPDEVARSIQMAGSPGARTSLAAFVSAAIATISLQNKQAAIEMCNYLLDPAEQAIALAHIAFSVADNTSEYDSMVKKLEEAAEKIPDYEPELPLENLPNADVVKYLNPKVQTFFDISLRLPEVATRYSLEFILKTGSAYLFDSYRAQKIFDNLKYDAGDMESKEFIAMCKQILQSFSIHFDDIQTSFLKYTVAINAWQHDVVFAETCLNDITDPFIHAITQLQFACLRKAAPDEFKQLVDTLVAGWKTLPEQQHVVAVIMYSASVYSDLDEHTAKELLHKAEELAQNIKNPLSAALAFYEIASYVAESYMLASAQQAFTHAKEISNPYVRAHVMQNMLHLAIRSGNINFIADVLDASVTGHWSEFMAALQYAADVILDAFGSESVFRIYGSIFSAIKIIAGADTVSAPDFHIDGVKMPLDKLNLN
ncbi:hypothetical protein FC093_06340 [Ilyomonas limi]|uniref:Uncharacterized protein n=1 Tax=Ilyomonas limi TaxID=2575867 RepID=A0A4U3L5Y8_9BACT|nr:hypothetical protein [Ilyomonas limi]TKK70362.1 hypothetical protein FC093_06340 [Ilyomonas limi]